MRSNLLALAVFICGTGAVLAHALPGSVLLLRQQGSALQLTVQFPVDDLIIAAPELSALEGLPSGQPLPQELAAALARYLGRHLAVTKETSPLDLTMTDARVQSTYHDHLGDFALVVSQWQMTGAGDRSTPLILTYDAVMHEVRNHRAAVHWIEQNGESRQISEFGYFGAANGIPLQPPAVGSE
ncbi:hypothetical protein [Meridianimarinicoccus aquatilis]|uniref:Uncharacterized protein n=1 Tax=Meridianimarinicoccus aquatilis TaxID=2552766 RepID=A0A4R6B2M1_9RHOB|nr:hypothetical protein [Fluviibacterium aquatile]TDL90870.1 hypothetical protein E2L05_03700 [Fluviibacterium aquatile]